MTSLTDFYDRVRLAAAGNVKDLALTMFMAGYDSLVAVLIIIEHV